MSQSQSIPDRVPDECLRVNRGGKLFCGACREELSLRKNIIAKSFK